MGKKTASAGENVCLKCSAPCCRDLVMVITKPKSKSDMKTLEWYLHYDTAAIFIRNHRWYLQVQGKCIYLGPDNLCAIYERRPAICRRHNPPDCQRYGDYYDVLLSTPEELRDHVNKGKKPR